MMWLKNLHSSSETDAKILSIRSCKAKKHTTAYIVWQIYKEQNSNITQ